MLVEVIATTVKEAIDIEVAGADRIELVSGILEGGITPSISLINEVCNNVNIPVNIMVRPHSKSFVYDDYDLEVIYNDIAQISKTKANAIVFGSLNKNGTINEKALQKVVDIKGNLKLTFHRAIDATNQIENEFNKLLTYPIDTILTSAGKDKVVENIELINKFVSQAEPNGITVLAGAGLDLYNTLEFCKKSNVKEIHIGSAAKINKDNLSDIDIPSLSKLIKDVKEL